MKKRNLQNKELDEIGRKLLEAGSLPGDELERIVAAPHLFDAIKARVKAGQERDAESFVSNRAGFSFLSWQGAGAAFAGLVVVVLAIQGWFFLAKHPAPEEAVKRPKPAARETGPLPVSIAPPEFKEDEREEPAVKPVTLVYREVSKDQASEKVNFKKRSQRPRQSTEGDSGGEFYSLTFTGSTEEITSGAQVIRVELPRSSLFAMGVDLPVENGSDTVKADLLISADGVTRGVRLVK